MFRKIFIAGCAAAALLGAPWATAQDSKPIKIALIASKTGPSEAYARDTERGLRLGLEYLTQNTMTVIGRKIEVIVKDDQMKPELSKAMLTEALSDDKADIAVGTSWSGGALSMAPVAEEFKKILMLEPAIADSLTGANWNRYLFRASRNSFQDALATAVALKDGDSISFLAPDYVYGRDGIAAFKEAMVAIKSKAKIVHEEFVPLSTSDFTAPMQRIFDAMKGATGKKYLLVIWGAPNPIRKISELKPERYGIEFLSIGGANLENMKPWKGLDVGGGTYYYYGFPKNERLAGRRAHQALQATAGPVHRRRLRHRRRHHRRHQEGQFGRHREAGRRHGEHGLRHAQGQDEVPQGRPSGDAGAVPVQDEEGRQRRMGPARPRA